MTEFTPAWRGAELKGPVRATAAAVLAAAVLAYAPGALGFGEGRPNWSLLAQEDLAIRIHLGAAVIALLIGTALMAGVKGRSWHKRLGWGWVLSMVLVAASSFWIRELRSGSFSWIHGLSGWVLVILPAAVYAARRKRIRLHRRTMTGLFYGGLILAGLFAFMPGRVLWRVVLGYD